MRTLRTAASPNGMIDSAEREPINALVWRNLGSFDWLRTGVHVDSANLHLTDGSNHFTIYYRTTLMDLLYITRIYTYSCLKVWQLASQCHLYVNAIQSVSCSIYCRHEKRLTITTASEAHDPKSVANSLNPTEL